MCSVTDVCLPRGSVGSCVNLCVMYVSHLSWSGACGWADTHIQS